MFFNKLKSSKRVIALAIILFFSGNCISFAGFSREPHSQLTFDPALAHIGESFKGSSDKTIIYIQDVHVHSEAQKTIAALIEKTASSNRDLFQRQGHSPILVGVEGAQGSVDTSCLAKVANPEIKDRISEKLFQQGRLTGPEYFSIRTNLPTDIYGVDDAGIYEANRQAFIQSKDARTSLIRKLEEERSRLQAQASRIFSPRLKAWIQAAQSEYSDKNFQEKLDLYIRRARELKIRFELYPLLQKYADLRESSEAKKTSRNISPEEFFKELNRLDRHIRNELARSEEERVLNQKLLHLDLAKKVLGLQANTDELAEFILLEENSPLFAEARKSISGFYEKALGRDQIFVNRIVKRMNETNQSAAFLVTGGFHSDGVTQQFRERGISFIVLSPVFTGKNDWAKYEALLAQNHPSPAELRMNPGQSVLAVWTAWANPEFRTQISSEVAFAEASSLGNGETDDINAALQDAYHAAMHWKLTTLDDAINRSLPKERIIESFQKLAGVIADKMEYRFVQYLTLADILDHFELREKLAKMDIHESDLLRPSNEEIQNAIQRYERLRARVGKTEAEFRKIFTGEWNWNFARMREALRLEDNYGNIATLRAFNLFREFKEKYKEEFIKNHGRKKLTYERFGMGPGGEPVLESDAKDIPLRILIAGVTRDQVLEALRKSDWNFSKTKSEFIPNPDYLMSDFYAFFNLVPEIAERYVEVYLGRQGVGVHIAQDFHFSQIGHMRNFFKHLEIPELPYFHPKIPDVEESEAETPPNYKITKKIPEDVKPMSLHERIEAILERVNWKFKLLKTVEEMRRLGFQEEWAALNYAEFFRTLAKLEQRIHYSLIGKMERVLIEKKYSKEATAKFFGISVDELKLIAASFYINLEDPKNHTKDTSFLKELPKKAAAKKLIPVRLLLESKFNLVEFRHKLAQALETELPSERISFGELLQTFGMNSGVKMHIEKLMSSGKIYNEIAAEMGITEADFILLCRELGVALKTRGEIQFIQKRQEFGQMKTAEEWQKYFENEVRWNLFLFGQQASKAMGNPAKFSLGKMIDNYPLSRETIKNKIVEVYATSKYDFEATARFFQISPDRLSKLFEYYSIERQQHIVERVDLPPLQPVTKKQLAAKLKELNWDLNVFFYDYLKSLVPGITGKKGTSISHALFALGLADVINPKLQKVHLESKGSWKKTAEAFGITQEELTRIVKKLKTVFSEVSAKALVDEFGKEIEDYLLSSHWTLESLRKKLSTLISEFVPNVNLIDLLKQKELKSLARMRIYQLFEEHDGDMAMMAKEMGCTETELSNLEGALRMKLPPAVLVEDGRYSSYGGEFNQDSLERLGNNLDAFQRHVWRGWNSLNERAEFLPNLIVGLGLRTYVLDLMRRTLEANHRLPAKAAEALGITKGRFLNLMKHLENQQAEIERRTVPVVRPVAPIVQEDDESDEVAKPVRTFMETSERFAELEKKGEVKRLVDLFGLSGAVRLLVRMHGLPPQHLEKVLKHYLTRLDRDDLSQLIIHRKKRSDIKSFRNIRIPKTIRPADFRILVEELVLIGYREIRPGSVFMDDLKAEMENSENGEMHRKAYREAYEFLEGVLAFEPKGLRPGVTLRPYQKAGVKFMLTQKRVILADEQGLGKTRQVIAAAMNAYDGNGAKKILIISPNSAKISVWKKQFLAVTGLTEDDIAVAGERDWLEKAKTARVVITNYEAIRSKKGEAENGDGNGHGSDYELNDKAKALKQLPFDFIIADEAHRLRTDSLQSRAVREFHAEYQVIVTGTPLVGRKLERMYNMLAWLRPDRFQNPNYFKSQYTGDREKIRKFQEDNRDLILRRKKEIVAPEIPDKKFIPVYVELSASQKAIYQRILDNIKQWYSQYVAKTKQIEPIYLTKFEKLKQAAVLPALVENNIILKAPGKEIVITPDTEEFIVPGDPARGIVARTFYVSRDLEEEGGLALLDEDGHKITLGESAVQINEEKFQVQITKRDVPGAALEAVDKIVKEIMERGEKVVIMTGYLDVAAELKRRYESLGVSYLIGGMKDRDKIVDEFQKNPSKRLFISTRQTGGEAITLSPAANNIILLDKPWTPQEMDQNIDRIHRLGQTKIVNVYSIIAAETVMERVEEVLREGDMLFHLAFEEEADDESYFKNVLERMTLELDHKPFLSVLNDVDAARLKVAKLNARLTLKNDAEVKGLIAKFSGLNGESKEQAIKLLRSQLDFEFQSKPLSGQLFSRPLTEYFLGEIKQERAAIVGPIRYSFEEDIALYLMNRVIHEPNLDPKTLFPNVDFEADLSKIVYLLTKHKVFDRLVDLGLLDESFLSNSPVIQMRHPAQIISRGAKKDYVDGSLVNALVPNPERPFTEREKAALAREMNRGNLEAAKLYDKISEAKGNSLGEWAKDYQLRQLAGRLPEWARNSIQGRLASINPESSRILFQEEKYFPYRFNGAEEAFLFQLITHSTEGLEKNRVKQFQEWQLWIKKNDPFALDTREKEQMIRTLVDRVRDIQEPTVIILHMTDPNEFKNFNWDLLENLLRANPGLLNVWIYTREKIQFRRHGLRNLRIIEEAGDFKTQSLTILNLARNLTHNSERVIFVSAKRALQNPGLQAGGYTRMAKDYFFQEGGGRSFVPNENQIPISLYAVLGMDFMKDSANSRKFRKERGIYYIDYQFAASLAHILDEIVSSIIKQHIIGISA